MTEIDSIVDDIQAITRQLPEPAARRVLTELIAAILSDDLDCYATHDGPELLQ